MAELGGIESCLFLIVMLQFAEVETGVSFLPLTVEDGDDVTLPCDIGGRDRENCDSIKWRFPRSIIRSTVNVVTNGQIDEESKAESDRLRVSENCSLVIKKVKGQDAGYYSCSLSSPRRPELLDIFLSVVTLTKHEDNDEVTLNCTVWTHDQCEHTVKWRLNGRVVNPDNRDMKTSQSLCSTSLSFKTSHVFYTSSFTSLKCEVTDGDKVMQFSLRNSPSGEDKTTTEEDTKAVWWKLVLFCVGLAALIITVVAVNMWARVKERRTQTEEHAVRFDAEDDAVNYENMRPADGV